MSTTTLNLTPDLLDYLKGYGTREHEVLKALRRTTVSLPGAQMQISPEQGQLMGLLIKLIGARKTLEVGTFTGYSALAVALALPMNGKVITCDIDDKMPQIAKDYWERAGVDHKIELKVGPALDTLKKMIHEGVNDFDFAFIDADKANYYAYYECSLQLVKQGGLIAIDNVLWDGLVVDPDDNSASTQAIKELNAKLRNDERIDLSMVPIGDGLTLARKR